MVRAAAKPVRMRQSRSIAFDGSSRIIVDHRSIAFECRDHSSRPMLRRARGRIEIGD